MKHEATIITLLALPLVAPFNPAHANEQSQGTANPDAADESQPTSATFGTEPSRADTPEPVSQSAPEGSGAAASPPSAVSTDSSSASPATTQGPAAPLQTMTPAPRQLSMAEQMKELQDYANSERERVQLQLKKEAPSWVIHINPLNLVFDEIMMGVDHGVSDRMQLTAQASYYEARVVATDNVGISIGGGVRYFPASNGYRGWYLAPTVSFRFLTMENTITGESGTGRLLIPTAMAGRQWFWGPVMFRVGAGLGYLLDVGTEVDGTLNTEVNTAVFGLDGALGIAL